MNPIDAIPHRPPIRCVERMLEASPDHCVAEGRAHDAWEPWIIEALAQTAALLNVDAFGATGRGMLVQVRRFDIVRTPIAGELLHLRMDIILRLPPVHLFRGEARDAQGELIAQGELKFYVEPGE